MDNILRNRIRSGMLAAFFLLPLAAHADDIDIFAGGVSTTELPNVLIIWDSSANWSANIPVADCFYTNNGGLTTNGPKASAPGKEQGTKFGIEKCAVYNVIDAMQPPLSTDPAKINVGIMLFNESPAQNSGGYPRVQFLPLTRANAALLKSTISAITIGGDKGNNAAFSKALYEAYLMFSRAVPYRGTAGTKWDRTAVAGGTYVGPPGSGCANHIIFLANGGPGEVTNGDAQALLAAAGGNATQILYPSSYIGNSDQANWADEYARFLRGVDVSTQAGVQSITTHGIAVVGAPSDGLYPNFIRAIAQQGGGQYYAASNVALLVKALTDIFNSIQSFNSVFASASLPIAVNAQGSYKNQLFVGVFRPDASARPRWVGNLKQYQMLYDPVTDSLELGDSMGNPALNPATGFFLPKAVSYWSKTSAFWANSPSGTPLSTSDLPDGDVVEKGANAELLRFAYATDQLRVGRKVYTCIGCGSGTTLSAAPSELFTNTNTAITTAMLGAADSTERAKLIDWIRGTDNNGDELGPGGTTTVRPSIHGDVLHSRPSVVNYGGAIGTVVYYGSNDGMLHAVNGNQTGTGAGNELWTFIPQELFGRFKRFRDDTPEIRFPATAASSSATPRDYFVDGPLTVYQKLDTAGAVAEVLLFVPMRRGGRFLYAFDVTNPSTPKYLWRKASGDISVLGQTWSEARVGTLQGYSVCPARTRAAAHVPPLPDPGCPILIMGAGYDNVAEDASPTGATTMGNAVLMLDALDGTLLKTLPTLKSVSAPVAVIDSDYDGYADRAYVVDMGANVYRIDFESAAGDFVSANWTITKIAALADGSSTRKFFYEPDVVLTQRFAALMFGSGNRERPLLATTNDRFYTLFDYKIGKGAPTAGVVLDASLSPVSASFNLSSSVPGCYYALTGSGEKIVTSSVSTGGYSYFSTNQPSPPAPGSCVSNLGIAKTYRMPLFCGTPDSVQLAGGGLPPSPVIGNVEIDIPASGSQPASVRMVPFIIGGSSHSNSVRSGIGVSRVPINVDPTRRRVYWFTSSGP
jgi:type IV pilus assembly protein PilY1